MRAVLQFQSYLSFRFPSKESEFPVVQQLTLCTESLMAQAGIKLQNFIGTLSLDQHLINFAIGDLTFSLVNGTR
uniref:Uncharacterized protein n=1 Tax=Arion vulgaris TaxID=1028688 RepID=A0A0B7BJ39_9EUPU